MLTKIYVDKCMVSKSFQMEIIIKVNGLMIKQMGAENFNKFLGIIIKGIGKKIKLMDMEHNIFQRQDLSMLGIGKMIISMDMVKNIGRIIHFMRDIIILGSRKVKDIINFLTDLVIMEILKIILFMVMEFINLKIKNNISV